MEVTISAHAVARAAERGNMKGYIMNRKNEINPTYYDTHCLADQFIRAEKNGTLIVIQEGESLESGIERLKDAQKRYKARLAAEKKAARKGDYFTTPKIEESALCVAEPNVAYGAGGVV
jgi:hypothetical protein